MNDMDAAVFATAGVPSKTGFGGPNVNYGSGQLAQMKACKSGGPHTYILDGIGVVQKLHYGGQDYCFKNLFRITTRPSLPLAKPLQVALTPSPKQGDSGAWIVVNSASVVPDWIGMLIGVDQMDGFAVDATDVLTWATTEVRQRLTVW